MMADFIALGPTQIENTETPEDALEQLRRIDEARRRDGLEQERVQRELRDEIELLKSLRKFGTIAFGVVSTDGLGGITTVVSQNLRFAIEGTRIQCTFIQPRTTRDYVAVTTGDDAQAREATIENAESEDFIFQKKEISYLK